jgi:hypothetical protein
MTENQLVSLDDAALDDVNGGLGFGLTVNETTLIGASIDADDGKLSTSLTLFGRTISAICGLKITL